jgi:Protein of unknown function (DUF1566)
MRLGSQLSFAAAVGANLLIPFGVAQAVCEASSTAEQLSSRFVIDEAMVYDTKTKLTWMRCSYGQIWHEGRCEGAVKPVDWDTAMSLRVSGDNAWRVPTKDELDSIVDASCKKPSVNEEVFPDTALMAYWTSTPSGPSYAWHVNFRWGISAWQYLRSNPYAVRFVRNDR